MCVSDSLVAAAVPGPHCVYAGSLEGLSLRRFKHVTLCVSEHLVSCFGSAGVVGLMPGKESCQLSYSGAYFKVFSFSGCHQVKYVSRVCVCVCVCAHHTCVHHQISPLLSRASKEENHIVLNCPGARSIWLKVEREPPSIPLWISQRRLVWGRVA